MTENELKNRVELNEEEVEDADGGLLKELGIAAAMTFGQVSPAAAPMMQVEPVVEEAGTVEAQTIEIKKEDVKLDGTLEYTGAEQEQKVKVVVNGIELVKDVEYKVKDNKATEPGTYKLTVEGIGNYSGKATIDFEIVDTREPEPEPEPEPTPEPEPEPIPDPQPAPTPDPEPVPEPEPIVYKDFTKADIQVSGLTYNGEAQLPQVNVVYEGELLKEGVDYEIEAQPQVEVGTYEMTVRGLAPAMFTGEQTVTFTIAEAEKTDLSDASIWVNTDMVYNGQEQAVNISVRHEGHPITEGVDYIVKNNVATNAGTYTVTIQGIGDYKGTASTTFTIQQATIGANDVTVEGKLTENGSAQTQKVSVKVGGITLREGVDYTVSGNTATKAGTYTLTVNGMGNYAGSIAKNFTIAEAEKTDVKDAKVTVDKQMVYNGQTQTAKITVQKGGQTLKEGVDYTVKNNAAVNAGTYTLTIQGIGKYKGSAQAQFTIAQARLKASEVKLGVSLTETGKEQTQTVTVTDGDKVLKEGVDYTVTGNKVTKSGSYTMVVKGQGNYTGEINVNFTVAQKKKASETKTGEQTNVGLYVGMGAAAAVALGAIAVLLGRKKR